MTFRQDDLDQAVEQGLITAAQAEGIARLAGARRKSRAFAAGREERFRMLGGFNDFFVAVGVVLLGVGLCLAVGAAQGEILGAGIERAAAAWTVALLIMWGLAEVLTARLRLTAPSIVAVMFLGCFAFAACDKWLLAAGMSDDGSRIISGVAAALVLAAHYMRFRLPFTLLPLALFGGYLFVMIAGGVVAAILGGGSGMDDSIMRWCVFGYGLITFALAMRFDVTDPERLTTRSDCGFWMHMIAAPMLVHPLVSPLFSGVGEQSFGFTPTGYALMAMFTLVLATVALIIDRRALLISGLSYIGIVISYAVTQLSGGAQALMFVTPLLLGLFVILLGIGWRTLRGTLMSHLPDQPWKQSLPPIYQAQAS